MQVKTMKAGGRCLEKPHLRQTSWLCQESSVSTSIKIPCNGCNGILGVLPTWYDLLSIGLLHCHTLLLCPTFTVRIPLSSFKIIEEQKERERGKRQNSFPPNLALQNFITVLTWYKCLQIQVEENGLCKAFFIKLYLNVTITEIKTRKILSPQ